MATKQQTPAAKLKKELKAAFPGLKISCKMDGYAIYISTDLMGSEYKKADLEAIAYNNKKFSYRSDDGETHSVYVDATENEPDSCEIDPNAALDEVKPQQNEVTTESTQEIEVEYESYTYKVGRCQCIGFRKVEAVEEPANEVEEADGVDIIDDSATNFLSPKVINPYPTEKLGIKFHKRLRAVISDSDINQMRKRKTYRGLDEAACVAAADSSDCGEARIIITNYCQAYILGVKDCSHSELVNGWWQVEGNHVYKCCPIR